MMMVPFVVRHFSSAIMARVAHAGAWHITADFTFVVDRHRGRLVIPIDVTDALEAMGAFRDLLAHAGFIFFERLVGMPCFHDWLLSALRSSRDSWFALADKCSRSFASLRAPAFAAARWSSATAS